MKIDVVREREMQYLSQQEPKPPESQAVVSQLISQSVSLSTAQLGGEKLYGHRNPLWFQTIAKVQISGGCHLSITAVSLDCAVLLSCAS